MKKVVKLSATWCGPCKVLAPVFEKIKEEMQTEELEFVSISADEDEFDILSVAHGIRNIPATLILNEEGELVDKLIGYINEEKYREFITKNV